MRCFMTEQEKVDRAGAGAAETSHIAADPAPARRRRQTSARKQEAVLQVLRGEDIELVARGIDATAADVSGWRDVFLATGASAYCPAPGSCHQPLNQSQHRRQSRRSFNQDTPTIRQGDVCTVSRKRTVHTGRCDRHVGCGWPCNLYRQKCGHFPGEIITVSTCRRETGITQPCVDQIGVHRVTCATETPGARVCPQIETFSSSDRNRFF